MSQLPEPASIPEPVSPDGAVAQPNESPDSADITRPADTATPADIPAPPAPTPPAPAPAAAAVAGATSMARLVVGIVLGAALAVFGGFILGEYPFTGLTPYIAGVLFALVIAEVVTSISRQQNWITAVASSVSTAVGLGLAVYISIGEGIDPLPVGGWMAVLIGAVVALVRGGLIKEVSRATSTPPSS